MNALELMTKARRAVASAYKLLEGSDGGIPNNTDKAPSRTYWFSQPPPHE